MHKKYHRVWKIRGFQVVFPFFIFLLFFCHSIWEVGTFHLSDKHYRQMDANPMVCTALQQMCQVSTETIILRQCFPCHAPHR